MVYWFGLLNLFWGGRAKSKQKGISKLSTQRKKKTVHQTAMDRLLYEIAVRTQHKAKSLEFEAKNLSDTVDNLRHENRALKRLQRSQTREIHDRHDFVDMANLSLKGFRKDVRFSEENRVDADATVRWVNANYLKSGLASMTCRGPA